MLILACIYFGLNLNLHLKTATACCYNYLLLHPLVVLFEYVDSFTVLVKLMHKENGFLSVPVRFRANKRHSEAKKTNPNDLLPVNYSIPGASPSFFSDCTGQLEERWLFVIP